MQYHGLMEVDVAIVNAFIANGNGGNPAGVVIDASDLNDEQMQHIAKEIGASETAFILPDQKATHHVRFFTPAVEVSLCGHATIASWSYMYANDIHGAGNYTQQTIAGLIKLSIDTTGLIFMEQPIQEFEKTLDFADISTSLNIPIDHFDTQFKPQIVQDALMLCFRSKELLNNFNLDTGKLIDFNKKHTFQGLHIFVMLDDQEALAAVRDFDPIVGIDEDAATGTTNGSFLTYLKYYNKLPAQEIYKIEQGEAIGQLSYIYGKFEDDRIWIGGTAQQMSHRKVAV
jgi:PhzF family phenazine biosynthesis protein